MIAGERGEAWQEAKRVRERIHYHCLTRRLDSGLRILRSVPFSTGCSSGTLSMSSLHISRVDPVHDYFRYEGEPRMSNPYWSSIEWPTRSIADG